MKQSLTKHLLFCALALAPIILQSCGPEDPPPPPTYHRHRGPLSLVEGLAPAESHPCPTAGTDCVVIIPNMPATPPALMIEKLDVFKEYLGNDNLSSYFSSEGNYATLFPNLASDQNSAILEGLINGTYKAAMLNDNTIGIYQGTLTDENIIFMVFVNYENI